MNVGIVSRLIADKAQQLATSKREEEARRLEVESAIQLIRDLYQKSLPEFNGMTIKERSAPVPFVEAQRRRVVESQQYDRCNAVVAVDHHGYETCVYARYHHEEGSFEVAIGIDHGICSPSKPPTVTMSGYTEPEVIFETMMTYVMQFLTLPKQ